jgi:hypothetical protein
MIGFICSGISDVKYSIEYPNAEKIVFATNEHIESYCTSLNIECIRLDEEDALSQFTYLNSHYYKILLNAIASHTKDPDIHYLLESNSYDVRGILFMCLKAHIVLQPRIRDMKIKQIHIRGNTLFSVIIREYLRNLNPDIDCREDSATPEVGAYQYNIPLKRQLPFERLICRMMNFRFIKSRGSKIILVSGSLNHLSSVVKKLTKITGVRIYYYEMEMTLKKIMFCLRHGMGFCLARKNRNYFNRIKDILLFDQSNKLIYEDTDITNFVNAVFRTIESFPGTNQGFDLKAIREDLKEMQPRLILLDEDSSTRRGIAMAAIRQNIACYSISHGIPGPPIFDGSLGDRAFDYSSSNMIVGSEFEKEAYVKIGYAANRICIGGTPRYDDLRSKLAAKNNGQFKRNKTIKKILYCTQTSMPYDIAKISPVSDIFGKKGAAEEYSKKFLIDTVSALENYDDIIVTVKPHFEDHAYFNNILSETKCGDKWRMANSGDDIFSLELDADLIITAASTVVYESMLIKTPVIVLNYVYQRLVESYEGVAGVYIAKSKHEAEQHLKHLLNQGMHDFRLHDDLPKQFHNFDSAMNNTDRVTNLLKEVIGSDQEKEASCSKKVTA